MKKFLFPLLLLLFAFSAKAQWSSMTITNHSGCDYTVRLFATYDVYQTCNYDNGAICIPAGATITRPSYWEWACAYNFVTGPTVPDAPSTWGGAAPCSPGGIGATPWGSMADEFNWRGALVYPCSTTPTPPGAQTGHPCGFTHFVGDGFCGPQNPIPPVHI